MHIKWSNFSLRFVSEVLLFGLAKRSVSMSQVLRGSLSVLGRVLLCTIFFMAAVGNDIPHFNDVVKVMMSVEIPAPQLMLVGAIVFLIAGSLSVIVGYKARFGAVLLLTFLVLATYYFHPFWKLEGQAQQEQMINFMKNLSMMGAMLFIMGNGSGPMSLDSRSHKRPTASALER
jgi:putative oxidoreductase